MCCMLRAESRFRSCPSSPPFVPPSIQQCRPSVLPSILFLRDSRNSRSPRHNKKKLGPTFCVANAIGRGRLSLSLPAHNDHPPSNSALAQVGEFGAYLTRATFRGICIFGKEEYENIPGLMARNRIWMDALYNLQVWRGLEFHTAAASSSSPPPPSSSP